MLNAEQIQKVLETPEGRELVHYIDTQVSALNTLNDLDPAAPTFAFQAASRKMAYEALSGVLTLLLTAPGYIKMKNVKGEYNV